MTTQILFSFQKDAEMQNKHNHLLEIGIGQVECCHLYYRYPKVDTYIFILETGGSTQLPIEHGAYSA